MTGYPALGVVKDDIASALEGWPGTSASMGGKQALAVPVVGHLWSWVAAFGLHLQVGVNMVF